MVHFSTTYSNLKAHFSHLSGSKILDIESSHLLQDHVSILLIAFFVCDLLWWAILCNMTQYEPLQKQSPGRERWSSTWWWWEIISIVVSIGCMIAVVVILGTMQDKPMDHWTLFVSINVFALEMSLLNLDA